MQCPKLLAIPLLIGISFLIFVIPSSVTMMIFMPDLLGSSESVSPG